MDGGSRALFIEVQENDPKCILKILGIKKDVNKIRVSQGKKRLRAEANRFSKGT